MGAVKGQWGQRAYPAKEGFKWCARCETEKSLTDFYRSSRAKDRGFQSNCKNCQHDTRNSWNHAPKNRAVVKDHRKTSDIKKRFYGLTRDEYDVFIFDAGGVCEVCGRVDARLGLDHCHTTGKIRGVLCGRCNAAMGLAGDDARRLRDLANYLDERG